MSGLVRPHRWQPTRLRCPWDSPGKNIGMGCHFLLQCMKVKSESEVTQSCPALWDPHGLYSPWNSLGRILEWVAYLFSRGSPQPRDGSQISRIAGGFFTQLACHPLNNERGKRSSLPQTRRGLSIQSQLCRPLGGKICCYSYFRGCGKSDDSLSISWR